MKIVLIGKEKIVVQKDTKINATNAEDIVRGFHIRITKDVLISLLYKQSHNIPAQLSLSFDM